jgi:hypothetical protein
MVQLVLGAFKENKVCRVLLEQMEQLVHKDPKDFQAQTELTAKMEM